MIAMSEHVGGSFRDLSGFVFEANGTIYRRINKSYLKQYHHLQQSGLYDELVNQKLLIKHDDLGIKVDSDGAYYIIKPEQLQFVSYPYEWSMSQFKDAALATLKIQEIALDYGMSLKDASAYNIQFLNGKPILIDTLSFDFYRENEPWIAYKQFCQHFIAPLALMQYIDLRNGMLMRLYIDGIPLDLAANMLPGKAKLNPSLMMHIFIHSKYQEKYAEITDNNIKETNKKGFSINAMKGLVGSLTGAVKSVSFPSKKWEWTDYYDNNNYTEEAFKSKEAIIEKYLDEVSPKSLWDIGANDGHFSLLASKRKITTIAIDNDPTVIERCYIKAKTDKNKYLHPILIDLTNPSPAMGWSNKERMSLTERGPADAIMALAVIHHLAIGCNVPLGGAAEFFAECGRHLIIEFVPKTDSQVKKMLSTRDDVFCNYTIKDFEKEFEKYYRIIHKEKLTESERLMYLMEKIQC